MRFEEMYQELKRISAESRRLLRESGYLEYGECEPEDIRQVYDNSDLLQKYRRLCKGLEMLDQLRIELEYYGKPVRDEGIISFDDVSKRYSLNGDGFHCGEGFEVLRHDDFNDTSEWVYTSIEMEWDQCEDNPNREGYYLTKCGKNTEIEGLKARRR